MSSFPEKLTDRFRRFKHRHFVPNADQYEELGDLWAGPEGHGHFLLRQPRRPRNHLHGHAG